MTTLIHQWVSACRAGTHPRQVCRVGSGWVIMGETQIVRGYCLLVPDPVVGHLNALTGAARQTALWEASVVGDALLSLTGALRINYEILGNLQPALHIHICPRYADEAPGLRDTSVFLHDWGSAPRYDEARDDPLREQLRVDLQQRLGSGGSRPHPQ